MTSSSPTPAMRSIRLLRRLLTGLEDRRALPGGAAREELDAHLLEMVQELGALVRAESASPAPSGPPPRPVALAMALALFSHPHLETLFSEPEITATPGLSALPLRAPDEAIVLARDSVGRALGLTALELDELREEVDRRAGRSIKQCRVVDWLWTRHVDSHFGIETLGRRLFPSELPELLPVGFVRRGPQLYAVVEQPALAPQVLNLPWTGRGESFSARYVDPALRRALCRCIGATDDEIVDLLDRAVTSVPRADAARFVHHDRWRARAVSGIVDLAVPHGLAAAFTAPIPAAEVPIDDLLRRIDGEVRPREQRATFDRLAMPRVTAMMRQLYAEICARLPEPGVAGGLALADLDLLDLGRHLRAVLAPLIGWARSDRTVAFVAERFGISEDAARAVLTGVAETWTDQIEQAWCGPPRRGRPRSVQAILTVHLVRTLDVLRALWDRQAQASRAHRDLLVLYVGHYFAEAPVHALWAEGLTEVGAPLREPLADGFWAAWRRVIDALDAEVETFSGRFRLEL